MSIGGHATAPARRWRAGGSGRHRGALGDGSGQRGGWPGSIGTRISRTRCQARSLGEA
ncbi:conserved hypothetical protein [Rhodospirillum centenum SW]|uniref:Uncharacterized protein n=1 Tax=Rhodospirillum centenum (strain ATCC 51521 / SW) TaxID=414684 RepID=B6IY58_RHOCS|nr:conserved hypothetical protein [Rhodospirillum centenum SW]